MTIFDLLFIVLFLASVVTLLFALIAALRGRGAQALATLRNYAICLVLYFAIVLIVAITSPQRTIPLGEPRCFDDWCLAVTRADRAPDATVVHLRLSSRARRVPQRELGIQVHLIDAQGRRFDPQPDPAAVPFDVMLQPGQAVDTTRTFALPADARDPGIVITHEGSFCFPGCFIIGDDANPLHKPTALRLP